jgi:hypothetical protein
MGKGRNSCLISSESGKERTSVEKNRSREFTESEQPIHQQAELPVAGTSLNPVEEEWAFDRNAAAAPANVLANAMQQGE